MVSNFGVFPTVKKCSKRGRIKVLAPNCQPRGNTQDTPLFNHKLRSNTVEIRPGISYDHG